ncbi:ubiquinol-cytochrome c reductase complex ubiquinone-binding protein [Lophium mytilinum]|uniref:Cytochrome b-c1 complex subunit 8 n=1 Tax=Lophium mytilinum TaxID=390894 RepID=A0A6A6RFC7_9PEZI|nr:ubiquinol-cytochrome c reductase complex ubiquinone-binding protein [Lophium mytilinum]
MAGGGNHVTGTPSWPIGGWGNPNASGGQPQKYITSYSISANRQRPLAGALNAAIFNTWRRFRGQVLYVAPPLVASQLCMMWLIERREFLDSKAGRKAAELEK